MTTPKPTTASLRLLPPSRLGALRRRWRRRGPWRRLLEMPWLWGALLVLGGALALMPGSLLLGTLLSAPPAAGSVAGRDYVASHDLMLFDAAATGAKQAQARQQVLPVYDFDPGVLAQRESRVSQLFVEGRERLPRARDEAARLELARDLAREPAPLPQPATPAAPAAGEGSAPSAGTGAARTAGDPGAGAAAGGAGDEGGAGGREALRASADEVMVLVRQGFSGELEDRMRGVLTQALRHGVVENKALLLDNRLTGIRLRNLGDGVEIDDVTLFDHLGYPDETRDFLEAELRGWGGLSAADRRTLGAMLLANISPNLHYNPSETLARRELAEAAAGQAFTQIRKGQIIARKGDVIDAAKVRLLDQMRGKRPSRLQLPEIAATLLLLALAAWALWLGLAGEHVAGHSRERLFGESALLLVASLAGARLSFLVAGQLSASFQLPPFNEWRGYALAVPFAALALSAALLLRRHAALVLAVLFSLLAGRLAVETEGLWVALYAFAGSLAAIFAVDRLQFRQRLVMPRTGLIVGGVNVTLALIAAGLGGPAPPPLTLGFELLCALGGGLLAAAVASFAVPVLEAMLGITTDIKLVELSNTNLPLLRQLAFAAPGTFQHSLMVANLAKEGCEAIGADAVLAYTGALYHDIGKIFRADYFIENQRPGQNRHDRLLPSMSVLILINHVKEGAELARRHHLPQVIVDAIEQHHGTRLMTFFYSRAQEQREREASDVREADYRYPGPRPRNKVMGVLMLADAVEAASRTLADPTPAKLRGVIRTLLDDCLHDGQLDKTDLTLADLSAVSEAFLRVLSRIFHQRVDYPGFDFNARVKREKRPQAGAARAS
jgi:putative nucleotidyltransferase with HDIG domain